MEIIFKLTEKKRKFQKGHIITQGYNKIVAVYLWLSEKSSYLEHNYTLGNGE